jgi:hypothetical protein
MENEIYDWTMFTLRMTINAELKDILSFWTSQKKMESFFLEKAQFIKSNKEIRAANAQIEAGDKYLWKWFGSSDIANGEMLYNNNESEMRFSFFECIVTVKVFVFESENMITLTQSNIPTDEQSKKNLHLGCTRGWTFYLTNLKSILEGGIDLRNRNVKLGNVVNT